MFQHPTRKKLKVTGVLEELPEPEPVLSGNTVVELPEGWEVSYSMENHILTIKPSGLGSPLEPQSLVSSMKGA